MNTREINDFFRDNKYSYKTNYISSIPELINNIENDLVDVSSMEPLLIVYKFEQYQKLFYFLRGNDGDIDWSGAIHTLNKYNNLYSEIVTNNPDFKTPFILEKLGFEHYRTYLRKKLSTQIKEYRELMNVRFAEDTDCYQILELLGKTFDPMCDRIPSEKKLKELLRRREVLKIDVNDKCAGVLLYSDSGNRSYISCLCVAEEYRNSVIGYSLMAKYFNLHIEGNSKYTYLWVDSSNIAVKKLHERFGFYEDGTKNYIYIRRGMR